MSVTLRSRTVQSRLGELVLVHFSVRYGGDELMPLVSLMSAGLG